jgi:hypothetical protein
MQAIARKWTIVCALTAACLPSFLPFAHGADPVNDATNTSQVSTKTEGSEVRRNVPLTPSGSKRAALVIGNSAYEKVPKLANAVNDAVDICHALVRMDFRASCYYDLSSRRESREAIQRFVQSLSRTDTVFIYYAGHGVQSANENYLLPTSVDPRSVADIEEDGLGLSYVLRSLEEARSGPNIVILDACRETLLSTRLRGLGRGLAATEPPANTILVYATAPNQNAYDSAGSRSRNGLFAKHLLLHMNKSGLSVDQLFGIVAESVQKEAQENNVYQLPYRNSAISASYCLAGCANPLEEINAQLQRRIEELERRQRQRVLEPSQIVELQKLREEQRALASSQTRNQPVPVIAPNIPSF